MINLGISIGTDIVEVERITNAINNGGKFFLQRVFTKKEIMKINANEPDFGPLKNQLLKRLVVGFGMGCALKILR